MQVDSEPTTLRSSARTAEQQARLDELIAACKPSKRYRWRVRLEGWLGAACVALVVLWLLAFVLLPPLLVWRLLGAL